MRIIVLGYIVRGPIGGMTWHHLNYVIGLARLGHDVFFLEDSDDYPSCYNPVKHTTGVDPAYGLKYAERIFKRIDLENRWAFHDAHQATWHGPCAGRIDEICSSADLVLNVSGVNPLRPWLLDISTRVFIDTDPVFEQIKVLTDPVRSEFASAHTHFLSFGTNIGNERSQIPDDGISWVPTRQPVVLDLWPVTPGVPEGRFTTIMQWESYPAKEYEGLSYGMKSMSFEPYTNLPGICSAEFELALGSREAPRQLLRECGWNLQDPIDISRDPWIYRQYILDSKAEFSVAKHGYVASNSGWFSERSACYLASGRPVLLQDTGFSDWLPTGSGVVAFRTPDEAASGAEEIIRKYEDHCRNARGIAEAYFGSDIVLSEILEAIGA